MALTEQQIAELPEGTRVVVTWSGGNGPHTYSVHQCRDRTYVWNDRYQTDEQRQRAKHYNPLSFIGDGPPFTTVDLAPTGVPNEGAQ